jgi:hypothetical protein
MKIVYLLFVNAYFLFGCAMLEAQVPLHPDSLHFHWTICNSKGKVIKKDFEVDMHSCPNPENDLPPIAIQVAAKSGVIDFVLPTANLDRLPLVLQFELPPKNNRPQRYSYCVAASYFATRKIVLPGLRNLWYECI